MAVMLPATGPATAAMPHRLGHPQMAFVRAWAEGVDPAQAWQRYLGQGQAADARRVRAALQGLLDVLRSVARAHGRPDLAGLLRRDPASMVEAAPKAPSLDEFRALQPEDFYSEAELLELYAATHGAPDARSGTRRRQRLRARQLAALQWLETLAVREPQPADAVAGWLDERLAGRLAAVGLVRLADLKRHIRARGYHWHRHIPRVGPTAAARVVQWWQQHARSLGALPAWALVAPGQLDRAALLKAAPVVQQALQQGGQQGGQQAAQRAGAGPATQGAAGLHWIGPPRPLERLELPTEPAHRHAQAPHPGATQAAAAGALKAAAGDLQAIHSWLAQRKPGSATWRAYRKEAERLLLWALWVAGKPVSWLEAADLPAYEAFLATPPAGWTAARGTPRWHEDWRPFEGPLSARSAAMALGIVRGMLEAWVAQGHLAAHPWAVKSRTVILRTVKPRTEARPGQLRALAPDQLAAVAQWLARCSAAQGHRPALLRLHALWQVACSTGLRPAELVNARLGWLRGGANEAGRERSHQDAAATGATRLWLEVPANATAGQARTLALDAPACAALQRYLLDRRLDLAGPGVEADARNAASGPDGADAPLFAQLRREAPLSPARLYELMAQALASCADDLALADADCAAALRLASTHWLRHGFGLQAAAAGAPVAELQQRMGHRSRASTAAYRRALRSASAGPSGGGSLAGGD